MLHRQGSFAIIHSAVVAEQNRHSSRIGLGRRNSVSSTSIAAVESDSIRPLQASQEAHDSWDEEVRFGRLSLPVWEGALKQKKPKLFGMRSDVWRDRWVRVDPKAGVLSIWSVRDGQESLAKSLGPAKKEFDLRCVRGLDSNRHHRDIMILFSNNIEKDKVKYALQFRAATTEDYNNWMFVLGHFGMRHDIMGLDPQLRSQLTRKFSMMTLNTGLQHDDSIDEERPADDTASHHSNVGSESTNCSIQTLDSDAFRELSVVLEDVSPCNAKWCEQVGVSRLSSL